MQESVHKRGEANVENEKYEKYPRGHQPMVDAFNVTLKKNKDDYLIVEQ